MEAINYQPIGVIHSPFLEPKGTPIQPPAGMEHTARLEIFPEYAQGLKDLQDFSHIYIIYHWHRSAGGKLLVKPFLDTELRGIFATRSPARPNSIGLSIVELIRVETNIVTIRGVDVLDGTPLLDIKPLVPEFDERQVTRVGWYERKPKDLHQTPDDGRFAS